MTDTQKSIFKAIKEFIKENGYSPTVRELAKITVKHNICLLEIKGYITTAEGKARTIVVVPKTNLDRIKAMSVEE